MITKSIPTVARAGVMVGCITDTEGDEVVGLSMVGSEIMTIMDLSSAEHLARMLLLTVDRIRRTNDEVHDANNDEG